MIARRRENRRRRNTLQNVWYTKHDVFGMMLLQIWKHVETLCFCFEWDRNWFDRLVHTGRGLWWTWSTSCKRRSATSAFRPLLCHLATSCFTEARAPATWRKNRNIARGLAPLFYKYPYHLIAVGSNFLKRAIFNNSCGRGFHFSKTWRPPAPFNVALIFEFMNRAERVRITI